MKILEYLKDNIVYLDGGMGTLLQKRGLLPGELPERWNLSHPYEVMEIHKEYFDAGSNIVVTNTFGLNSLKFDDEELDKIAGAAVENARKAQRETQGKQETFVAFDIGPLGKLLKPYGDLEFEKAVEIFAKLAKAAQKYRADLVIIETMSDSLETKAALLAVKENTQLPVFVSNAYGEDGKLMTGASPAAMVAMLEAMGADAIGVNCSLGPDQLVGVVNEYLSFASVPVLVKPNAGLPRLENGRTVYDISEEQFAEYMKQYAEAGARFLGGCCGTNPDYIAKIVKKTAGIEPVEIEEKNRTVISSYTHAVEFGDEPILIGERINPTGKKRFKEALRAGDIEYVLREGIAQEEKGAQVLDVNVGLPEIDEKEMLSKVLCELQAIIDLPLQIDTTNIEAMEAALRRYNGKAMINSVNGKVEVMEKVFPLAKKYGGLVVCLTLDEDGIPETAEGRVKIAKKIIDKAASYGIAKKDLIFDTLTLTISTDKNAAKVTLEALRRIKEELGCKTSLGVSNVSFGLPNRGAINSTFFAMALAAGLDAAIMNPKSSEMMKTYYSFRALSGFDENCAEYIERVEELADVALGEARAAAAQGAGAAPGANASGRLVSGSGADGARGSKVSTEGLKQAVIKGLKEQAKSETIELLKTMEPLEIVNGEIIPALDVVGEAFEEKKMYLPQLLMAAEASQAAFEEIKKKVPKASGREKIVIATVKGDIHDIGKNIVKLILENYGFDVLDLGKDVEPEKVVEETIKSGAKLVGLSALMTTTVGAMEETIKLLNEKTEGVKVCVGGAVLTKEYADKIGADFYAKDAMATVRFALNK